MKAADATVIGLIGPIAAGKTVVADELERRGAAVIRADEVSRELLQPGEELLEEVIAEFGEQYRREDGSLDRAALGEVVFADECARRRLERIVHPAMVRRMAQLVAQRRKRAPLVVVEAANLVEMGGVELVDETVLVTAPRQTRVRRLMRRDGMSREAAENRVALHEKLGIGCFPADFRVDSEGGESETRERVQRLWGELVKRDRDEGAGPGPR